MTVPCSPIRSDSIPMVFCNYERGEHARKRCGKEKLERRYGIVYKAV